MNGDACSHIPFGVQQDVLMSLVEGPLGAEEAAAWFFVGNSSNLGKLPVAPMRSIFPCAHSTGNCSFGMEVKKFSS